MTYISEYLAANLDLARLTAERKKQLKTISALRGNRDILVFASDLSDPRAPISIEYSDRIHIQDQVAGLKGEALDLILETPGGSGEVAEDIVRFLRQRYSDIAVIVPGTAKSAGTLIAMSANDILMEPEMSSLGPIDAQLTWQGKVFSAHALIAGFNKIKKEVDSTQHLSKAYIPVLQGISPGELEHAQNALDFAKNLVTEWLAQYKFQNWSHHSSTGAPVTVAEKKARAAEIANELCDHDRWKSHGRSIRLSDLLQMRLLIEDFSKEAKLAEAIKRYYALLKISFESNLFKIIETPDTQILRHINAPANPAPLNNLGNAQHQALFAQAKKPCVGCQREFMVSAKLRPGNFPLPPGQLSWPKNNVLICPHCNAPNDLTAERAQILQQFGPIYD